MTKRQQIVDAIKTRFQAIASVDSGRVYRHLDLNVDSITEPTIIYRDMESPVTYLTGVNDHRMRLEVDVLDNGKTADDGVRELMQDVLTAINQDITWGGLAIDTTAISYDLKTTTAGKRLAGGMMSFDILYRTGEWAL